MKGMAAKRHKRGGSWERGAGSGEPEFRRRAEAGRTGDR